MVKVEEAAGLRIDAIYRYTRSRWGDAQADIYVRGLFDAFDRIAAGTLASRPVPAELGVAGYSARYRHHVIYWRRLDDGEVGIVTVLHERMHQIDRFRDDFGL